MSGVETPEAVEKRAHRLVREKLGIERRLVHARRASWARRTVLESK